MKKLIGLLLFAYAISCFGQEKTIITSIHEIYTTEILTKVYDQFTSDKPCTQKEELLFIIQLKGYNELSADELVKIQDAIDVAFEQTELAYKTKCSIPTAPIYVDGKDFIFPDLDKYFYVEQEVRLSKKKDVIIFRGNTACFFKYDKNGIKIPGKKIANTHTEKRGKLAVSKIEKPKDLEKENENKAELIDNAIDRFKAIQDIEVNKQSPIKGKDYVDLCERIFEDSIRVFIEPFALRRDLVSFKNFLTHFLGNAYMTYHDSIPKDSKKYQLDYHKTDRVQEPNAYDNENYSLFKISASEKQHKIKLPTFSHWVTIQDVMLRESIIGCASQRYIQNICLPLQEIYGETVGQKLYDDIIRFFSGFSTALTTQDINRLYDYYHDIAIRNFYPGNSNSRKNIRTKAIRDSAIVARYAMLEKKGYEIYMTLDEGEFVNAESKVEVALPESTVNLKDVIGDNEHLIDELKKMPAFLLEFYLEQKWRTIVRYNQETNLEDEAMVNFNLLCLNMSEFIQWLSSDVEDNEVNRLTIFTFFSYLHDLFKDMNNDEKAEFRNTYSEVYDYLRQRINESKKMPSKLEDIKEIKEVYRNISSVEKFNEVRANMGAFMNCDLRNDVHNRRFLFNLCYLKIIYQYTYDNEKKENIGKPNDEMSLMYKIIMSNSDE